MSPTPFGDKVKVDIKNDLLANFVNSNGMKQSLKKNKYYKASIELFNEDSESYKNISTFEEILDRRWFNVFTEAKSFVPLPRINRHKNDIKFIVFDWDDTLFPTSALYSLYEKSNNSSEAASRMNNVTRIWMNDFDELCVNFLKQLINRNDCKVVILTNATLIWVIESSLAFMPKLCHFMMNWILNDKLLIRSARHHWVNVFDKFKSSNEDLLNVPYLSMIQRNKFKLRNNKQMLNVPYFGYYKESMEKRYFCKVNSFIYLINRLMINNYTSNAIQFVNNINTQKNDKLHSNSSVNIESSNHTNININHSIQKYLYESNKTSRNSIRKAKMNLYANGNVNKLKDKWTLISIGDQRYEFLATLIASENVKAENEFNFSSYNVKLSEYPSIEKMFNQIIELKYIWIPAMFENKSIGKEIMLKNKHTLYAKFLDQN